MAFVEDDESIVVLNYGTQSTGFATSSCRFGRVLHRGKRFRLTQPRVIPVDSAKIAAVLATGKTRSALQGTLVPA
jgi:hypothetical protein